MKRILALLGLICLLLCSVSCTENLRTRRFGGTMTIDLPPGQKLVTATWKADDSLWYLTRPAHLGEQAETLLFKEKSNFGLNQGTVVCNEH